MHPVANKQLFLFMLCFLGLLLLFPATAMMVELQSQSVNGNLKLLLESLNSRMQSEEGFLVTFQFNVPLVEEEKSWIVGDINDPYARHITEVGNDYICLQEIAGAAIFIRCIPFSNITSVSYIDN